MRELVWLGIEGGGSKARAILEHRGRVLVRMEPNGINPRDTGYEEFEARLTSLISPLFQSVSRRPGPPSLIYACAALAGAGDASIRRRCRLILGRLLGDYGDCRRLAVITDADALVETRLAHSDGMVLIAGTGSICLGVKHLGKTRRVVREGGKGGSLDQGSGFRIGARLVQHTLGLLEGWKQRSICTQMLCARFGISLPDVASAFFPAERSKVASLTGIVFEGYRRRDRFARAVLREAVSDLVEMVVAVKVKTALSGRAKLYVAGGLFHNPTFFRLFKRQLREVLPQVTPHLSADDFTRALQLARTLARADSPLKS